jgi:hypothetical protein
MKRLFCSTLLALALGLLTAGSAAANTYYIAANGSDSNSGTSKSSPWAHAPGMKNCTGVCGSTNPQAGDSFIFRGGDNWHFANSGQSPYVGGSWVFNWSGNSSNCQLDPSSGSIEKGSCIYIGVDQSWYSGSSWSRPQMNMDNPLSTGRPSSCSFDESQFGALWLRGAYLVLDNFEWFGECWNSGSNASPIASAVVTMFSTQTQVTNNYFHGWTYGSGSSDDEFVLIAYAGCVTSCIVDHNVFDGSDSSLGTTMGQASGKALGVGSDIASNVFYHISNGYVGGSATSIHDNLFAYMFEPQGFVHGNIIEQQGAPPTGTYFYNNLMYMTNEGEGINIYTPSGYPGYIFNNVSFLYRANVSGTQYVQGNNGANCFLLENTGSSGARTFYIFNNTLEQGCSISQKNISLTQYFQNNHFVGYSPTSLSSVAAATMTDQGAEVYQSESAANSQGYTPSNNYAPTGNSDATVSAGSNLAGSVCNGLANGPAATACKSAYGGVTYNQQNHTAQDNTPVARPSSGAWDAGAYQYGSASAGPTAPSGLSATVQ